MYTMISPSKSSDAESGPPNDGSMEQDDFQVALYAYQTLHSILIKNGGSGFDALAEVFGNTNEVCILICLVLVFWFFRIRERFSGMI